MKNANGIEPGDVLILVGTRKGSFILYSDESRENWRLCGPFNDYGNVFHVVYDSRNGGTVLAAVNSEIWGSGVQISHDLGDTWLDAEKNPRMSEGSGQTVSQLWHIEPGRESEPGVLYMGAAPAALFRSHDWGLTWEQWSSLTLHPTRERWEPGLGGLCLHSIALDPESRSKMWVGISAVGVFRTEDSGETWKPMNRGVRADFAPEPFPEIGQCPHKMLVHPAKPETLYQQNHCGFFRSDDGGDQWLDFSDGLPSRFGFVVGLHPRDPETVFVLPEDSATTEDVGGWRRFVSDAKMRVYRSRNGGLEWEALTDGLPQKNAYIHVMREGMAIDSIDPCGIYIGTTSGQIYHSLDEGESWSLLIEHLPPINSVEVGMAK